MLLKRFKIVFLFALISTASFGLFQFYNKSSNLFFLTNPFFKAHGNNRFSGLLEEQVTQVRETESNDNKDNEASTVTEASKKIEASTVTEASKKIEAATVTEASNKIEASTVTQASKKIEASTVTQASKKIEASTVTQASKKIEAYTVTQAYKKIEASTVTEASKKIEASTVTEASKKIEASTVTEASKKIEASTVTQASKDNEASVGNNVSVKSEAPNAVQEKTQALENKTIGPCPDTPPNLVGALYIEFDYKRTLDQVREEAGSGLQMGGRFMPLDCIAKQKVAIIIPFRNRHDHLKHWLYYLHPILMRQQVDYGVYVINQDGDGVFNRAKLMNAGYVEALKEYDYDCFVFSDVDLVPMDDRNLYRCFDSPRHLAVAMDKYNFQLQYNSFFGGVNSLSKEQFLRINGFPNTYWGWGGEDDDIYNRILVRGMQISRPNLIIGRYRMIKHLRDVHNEANQINEVKMHNAQWTMDKDGINSLNYKVKEMVKDTMYTFISVDIQAPQYV